MQDAFLKCASRLWLQINRCVYYIAIHICF